MTIYEVKEAIKRADEFIDNDDADIHDVLAAAVEAMSKAERLIEELMEGIEDVQGEDQSDTWGS